MFTSLNVCVWRTPFALAALCLCCSAVSARTRSDETPAAAGVAPRAGEALTHHQHRMKKFDESQTLDSATQKSQCRYESDIAQAPPHKQVALTFDDGPDAEQTPYILSLLEKHKVPATFFMIGEKAQNNPALVGQVKNSPFALVGNHSWSHPNFHDIPLATQTEEIQKSNAEFAHVAGFKLFRYPYGNSTCAGNQQVQALQYKIAGWHVDSCDWAFDHTGKVDAKEALVCGVLAQNRENFLEHVLSSVRTRRGGIILMHEIHRNTLKELDALITRLLAEGYTFGRLDQAEWAEYLR